MGLSQLLELALKGADQVVFLVQFLSQNTYLLVFLYGLREIELPPRFCKELPPLTKNWNAEVDFGVLEVIMEVSKICTSEEFLHFLFFTFLLDLDFDFCLTYKITLKILQILI